MAVTPILLALIVLLLLVIAGGIAAIVASNPEAKQLIAKAGLIAVTIIVYPPRWLFIKIITVPTNAIHAIFRPVMRFPKIAAPLSFAGNLIAIAYLYGLVYGLGLTFFAVFILPVMFVLFRPEISWSELPEVMHKFAAGMWDFVTLIIQWIVS
jgi:hypothetical protein